MSNMLVVHGTESIPTRDLAMIIAREFRRFDHRVTVCPADHAPAAGGFDAVLVGGALEQGHWSASVVAYLRAHGADMAIRPSWLFQWAAAQPADPDRSSSFGDPVVLDLARRFELGEPITFVGSDDQDRQTVRAWAHIIGSELDAFGSPFPLVTRKPENDPLIIGFIPPYLLANAR